MKIVIFNTEPWERQIFDSLATNHSLEYVNEPLTAKNASQYQEAQIISTFIYSDLHANVLAQLPNLQLIATRSTGFDHIDSKYCQEHNIKVCNVPTYGDHTVAEHAFGLLLAISHKLVEASERTRRGDFSVQGLQGFDLRGKTLGVIGTGNIGLCMIEMAKGFQMKVLAFDIKPKEDMAQKLGFSYASLEEVLAASDIVSLHVPANPHTENMISTTQFEQMKDGVVFINTARGSVVDTYALIKALAEGKVAAAGLDALPEEPIMREEAEVLRSVYTRGQNLDNLLADHVLLRLRNVIITPHSAYNTREAVQRISDTTLANITAFIEGESQLFVVS